MTGESDKQRAAQPRKHDEQHAAALDKVTDYVEEQLISLNIDWKGKCSGHTCHMSLDMSWLVDGHTCGVILVQLYL